MRKGLPDPSLSHHPLCYNLAHLLDIVFLPRTSQVDKNILEPKVTGARAHSGRTTSTHHEAIDAVDLSIAFVTSV
jgi:hypothetical protein